MADVRILGPGDSPVLERVAPGVFDRWIDRGAAQDFLTDPRMHLAVAIEDGVVVGMASALHQHHPDRPAPELWIGEVGVAEAYRRQGVAHRLLEALFERASTLGCSTARVLAERGDEAAQALYANAGGGARECVMYTFPIARPPDER